MPFVVTPFRFFVAALALSIVVLLLFLAFVGLQPPDRDGQGPVAFGPTDELTISPVPGRPGPYEVCVEDYDVDLASGDQIVGRIFAPVLDDRTCQRLADQLYNLVVIAHADGANSSFASYDALGTHLASNAFVVVSIDRYPDFPQLGAWMQFDDLLARNLDWIYNSGESGVQDMITDEIALIGHSAGGRSVLENAGAVAASGKSLEALIVMSPTVGPTPYTFNGVVPALLSIHVTGDTDSGAYGPLTEFIPTRSAIRVYDDAGLTNDPDTFGLEKDLLYASASTHFYQDETFLLAFVNAYLQAHLNDHAIFRRFFKNQEHPPSLPIERSPENWRQAHEDTSRFTLDDFENGVREENRLGGVNSFTSFGFGFAQEGAGVTLDPFSPHNTGLMHFQVAPLVQGGVAPTLRMAFPEPADVTARRWLGLRIAQVYHPALNPEGQPQSFSIRLTSDAGDTLVPLTDYGLPVRFPSVGPIPFSASLPGNSPDAVTALNGGTKNVMQSYLVSLRDFEGVDLTAVTGVELVFNALSQETVFVIDDVAFYDY